MASFYESLFADEIIDVNPTHRLRAREKPKRRTPGTAGRALSDEQAMDLYDAAAADSPNPERSALLIVLMLYLGLRVTEAISVAIEDYTVGIYGPQIIFVAKGGDVQIKTLDEFIDQHVRAWLAVRPAEPRLPALQPGARAKRTLVCTEDGRHFMPRGEMVPAAGGRISPFVLKRQCGVRDDTRLLQNSTASCEVSAA